MLLGRFGAVPLDFCPDGYNGLLPLSSPSLSILQSSGLKEPLITALLRVSLDRTVEYVRESIAFPEIFARFVFSTPSFFVLASEIFPGEEELRGVFIVLAEISRRELIRSFLAAVREVARCVIAAFAEVVPPDDLVDLGMDLPSLFYFLVQCQRFDLIARFRRDEDLICGVLRDIYAANPDFYLELLSTTDFPLVALAIASRDVLRDENVLSLLMRHDCYIASVFHNAPDVLVQLVHLRPKENYADRIAAFLRSNSCLVEPEAVRDPSSVVHALFCESEAGFLSLFDDGRIGRAVGIVLDATFPRPGVVALIPFPGVHFFSVIAARKDLPDIIRPVLVRNRSLILSSDAWFTVFSTHFSLMVLAVEYFRDDWDFTSSLIGAFDYGGLSLPALLDAFLFFSREEDCLAALGVGAQLRLWGRMMSALEERPSKGIENIAMDFLLSLEGGEIWHVIDEPMKEMLFERLLLPAGDDPRALRLIAAVSEAVIGEEVVEEPERDAMSLSAVWAWINALRTINPRTARPEVCNAAMNAVQQAIIATDVGYDPAAMHACLALLGELSRRVQPRFSPELLVVCIDRLEFFDSQGDGEMIDIYLGLLRRIQAPAPAFAALVAEAVKNA
jgi:hypothetical protein